MTASLNLFPARVPIGHATLPDQTQIDILPTPELLRALAALQVRVGGPNGMSISDLEVLAAFEDTAAPIDDAHLNDWENEGGAVIARVAQQSRRTEDIELSHVFDAQPDTTWRRQIADLQAQQFLDPAASLGELAKALQDLRIKHGAPFSPAAAAGLGQRIDDLQAAVEIIASASAALAEIKKYAQDIELQLAFNAHSFVDWTRPGTLGSSAANSVAATTLTASAAVALSPASANVVISPTGTGVVTVNPATAGTLDNMTLGATTPKPASVTTLSTTGNVTVTANVVLVGKAVSGNGGQYRMLNDAGTLAWLAGLLGSAGSVDFSVYNPVTGSEAININATTNVVKLAFGLDNTPIGASTAKAGRFSSVQVTTGGSTTISTGVGSIKMSSANPATNAAWIPIIYAGTTYYVPAFTTNSP